MIKLINKLPETGLDNFWDIISISPVSYEKFGKVGKDEYVKGKLKTVWFNAFLLKREENSKFLLVEYRHVPDEFGLHGSSRYFLTDTFHYVSVDDVSPLYFRGLQNEMKGKSLPYDLYFATDFNMTMMSLEKMKEFWKNQVNCSIPDWVRFD